MNYKYKIALTIAVSSIIHDTVEYGRVLHIPEPVPIVHVLQPSSGMTSGSIGGFNGSMLSSGSYRR